MWAFAEPMGSHKTSIFLWLWWVRVPHGSAYLILEIIRASRSMSKSASLRPWFTFRILQQKYRICAPCLKMCTTATSALPFLWMWSRSILIFLVIWISCFCNCSLKLWGFHREWWTGSSCDFWRLHLRPMSSAAELMAREDVCRVSSIGPGVSFGVQIVVSSA